MSNRIQPGDEEMRIIVLGRDSHGKSTVANAMLGSNDFAAGTRTTSPSLAEGSKGGMKLKVLDTPDISESDMKGKEKRAEVKRWENMVYPGANVLVLVIRADQTYTERDFIAYRQVRRFIGGVKAVRNRLVVVFTFADGQDVNEVGDRMEDGSPKWMGKVFRQSRGRYIVFNGKGCGNLLDEVLLDDDDDDDSSDGRRSRGRSRSRSPKGRKHSHSPKGRKHSKSRSRSPKGRKHSKSRSRSRSPKGRKHSHSPKGRKHSRSRSRSPKGRKHSRSRSPKRHHKPKGGRGRRRGHSGKRRRGGWGKLLSLLCCCCIKVCKK